MARFIYGTSSRAHACAFLEANGVDPNTVLIDETVHTFGAIGYTRTFRRQDDEPGDAFEPRHCVFRIRHGINSRKVDELRARWDLRLNRTSFICGTPNPK